MLTRHMPTPRLLFSLMLALALISLAVALLLSPGAGSVVHAEGEPIERIREDGDGKFTEIRTVSSGVETQGYGGGLLIKVKDGAGIL